ncbi:MAG: Cof-type HAD-IIB family hydrolase [Clostridia bacterium]
MTIDTIVTDLDDTLLNEAGELSEKSLRVLGECKRRGIRVIPASGRALASMRRYVQELHTGLPYIGCNGSQIVSAAHEILHEAHFEPEDTADICSFLQENGFYVQVYSGEHFYYANECDTSMRYQQSSGMNGVSVGDLLAFVRSVRTPKILSVNHPEAVQRMRPIAQARFGEKAVFTTSKPFFLEVEPPGVTKGTALRRLAGMIGIDPEHTLVFGDSLNDLSMLAFTPHSVAVGNARDEVKRQTTYVCGANTEDGLARFVQEHVLNGWTAKDGEAHD